MHGLKMPKIPKKRNFYENRPIFSKKFAKSGGFLRVCGGFCGVFCVFALSCPDFCVFFVICKKYLCEFAICGKITENQERIKCRCLTNLQ